MEYFIIHRRDRNGGVIGMSKMSWPSATMHGPCIVRIRTDPKKRTFDVSVNRNKGLPIDWEQVFFGREITENEFNNYIEMQLFKRLRDSWLARFVKRYTKK